MTRSTAESIEILKAVNFIDSGLFGLSVDIFKVRLLICCRWSPGLARLGFSQNADLCFEFRLADSFLFSVHKGLFGPPYLEDGDLSAINLADFDIGELDLRHVGRTIPPSYDEKAEWVDQYEVHFPFLSNGSLQFRFSTLSVDTFDPESVDNRRLGFF